MFLQRLNQVILMIELKLNWRILTFAYGTTFVFRCNPFRLWTRQYLTRSFTTYYISFDTFTRNARISRSARYLVPIFIRLFIEFTMTARGTTLAGNLDRIATRHVTIRLIFSYHTCLSLWSKLTHYHFLCFNFAYISNLHLNLSMLNM